MYTYIIIIRYILVYKVLLNLFFLISRKHCESVVMLLLFYRGKETEAPGDQRSHSMKKRYSI